MQKVSNVSMIILMQQDIAQAVTFYQHLGLRLVFHLRDKWAEFDLSGVKIGLCPTSAPVMDRRLGIVFQVADVRTFYEEHKQSGMFIAEPAEALHGIMVSFKDPGGNIMDFYQPTPERIKEFAQQTSRDGCCKGSEAPTGCCKKQGSSDGEPAS